MISYTPVPIKELQDKLQRWGAPRGRSDTETLFKLGVQAVPHHPAAELVLANQQPNVGITLAQSRVHPGQACRPAEQGIMENSIR
jgi:hypothetical protein